MAGDFENCLEKSEAAANAALVAASAISRAAKAVERAAAVGSIQKLRTARAQLAEAVAAAEAAAADVESAWPWTVAEEEAYLEKDFFLELRDHAQDRGIPMHEFRGKWSASPVLIDPDPKQLAVRVNGKRVRELRPSLLLEGVQAVRKAKPSQGPEQFLEMLFAGYRLVIGAKAIDRPTLSASAGVRLLEIHQALTLLPEARKGYSEVEFARDLLLLDSSGINTTGSGHVMHLSAATTTKSAKGVLVILDDAGKARQYSTVAFECEG